MHVEGAPDPPPDAEDYLRDVVCEHGQLATNTACRRRISAEAYGLLHELFPAWKPPSTRVEPCAVCEALLHMSKEDKRECRKQAEEEKVRCAFVAILVRPPSDFVCDCRRDSSICMTTR